MRFLGSIKHQLVPASVYGHLMKRILWGWVFFFCATSFGVALSAQISNDECTTALQLTAVANWCSTPGLFTTVGATVSADPRGYCFPTIGSGPDVWYSFVAQGTSVQISIKGAGGVEPGGNLEFPQLMLYGGTCGALAPVQCASDAVGTHYIETSAEKLQIGQTYFIRVSARNGKSGSFQLCLNNYNPLPNLLADCLTGRILCSKDPLTIDFVSGEGLNPFEISGACERNSCKPKEYQTTWLKWSCGTPGSLTFKITPLHASDDLDFIVYELPAGVQNCSALTPIRCMSSGENVGQPISNWVTCVGSTGLKENEIDESEYCGCVSGSNNFLAPLNMTSGKSYALAVINYSRSGRGFQIEFGGSGTFSGTILGVDPTEALRVHKSVYPSFFSWPIASDSTITYRFKVYNDSEVPFVLDSIVDFIPAPLRYKGIIDSLSAIQLSNSSLAPGIDSSGSLKWVGKAPDKYIIGPKDSMMLAYQVRIPASVGSGIFTGSARGYISACPTAEASSAVSVGINCPVISGSITGSAGICTGGTSSSWMVSGLSNMQRLEAPSWDYGIQFVYFNSSTPIDVYTPDGILGTATLNTDKSIATLNSAILPNTPGVYYVYAILAPTPASLNCRPFAGPFVLRILNEPIVSLTGGGAVCRGNSTILSAIVEGGAGTCTLEWQAFNPPSGNWIPISGIIEPTLTVSPIATTQYRVVLKCTSSGCNEAVSNTQTVSVISDVSVTISAPTTICPGGTAALTAQVAGMSGSCSFIWQRSVDSISWETISTTTTSAFSVSPTATYFYRVQVSCSSTPCQWRSEPVKVQLSPYPDVLLTGGTAICPSGIATLRATITGGTPDCQLIWQTSPNTQTWTTFASGRQETILVSPFTTAYYRVIYACTSGNCGSDTSGIQIVQVAQAPAITISGEKSICSGGTARLTATLIQGAGICQVNWQYFDPITSTWEDLPGAAGNQVTVIPSKTTAYRATYACNGAGCGTVFSNSQTITVLQDPVITIEGTSALCPGGVGTLHARISGGFGTCTLEWQQLIQNTWTTIAGQRETLLPISGLDSTMQYRALVTCTGESCDPAISNVVTVQYIKEPLFSITGADTLCAGNTTVLRATGAMGTCTLQWALFNTTTQAWQDIPGAIADTLVITPAATTNYRVHYVCTLASCENGISIPIRVTVIPKPIVTVSGPNTLCAGSSAVLQALVQHADPTCSFIWQSSEDGIRWSTIDQASGNTIEVAPVITMYYRVLYNCRNACGESSSIFKLPVFPLAKIEISGGGSVCFGGAVTLLANTSGGVGICSIQWQSSTTGSTWTDISNAQANSLTVTPIQNTFYRATYTCTGSTCSAGPSNSIEVRVFADPIVRIAGDNTICTGGSSTLTATVSGGVGNCALQWQSSLDGIQWNILEGAQGSNILVTPGSTTQYRALYACDGRGCNSQPSNIATITVVEDPKIQISGPGLICEGNTVLLSSTLTGGAGDCKITWQRSVDGQNWENISAPATPVISLEPLQTTFYRAVASCTGADCGIATSNVLRIQVAQGAEGKSDRKDIANCSAVAYDLQRNVNILGNGKLSTFTWVALSDNLQVTGESVTPVQGSVITDVLTNLSSSPQTIVYQVTAGQGNCPESIFRITVTLGPRPKIACVFCESEVNIELGDSCSRVIMPAMLTGINTIECPDAKKIQDLLEIVVDDGNFDNVVEGCGVFRCLIRLKPQFQNCYDFQVCQSTIRVTDSKGPLVVQRTRACNRGPAPAINWRDTFLCTDVLQMYNNAQSWLSPTFPYYAGTVVFEDACKNRCACSTTMSVNDELTLFDCSTIRQDNIWAKINRTFTGVDCKGNTTVVQQTLFFRRIPPDVDYYSKRNIKDIIIDDQSCAAPSIDEMVKRFKERYYIFDNPYACGTVVPKIAYFREAVLAGAAQTQMNCSFSFNVDVLSDYPLCVGGRRVEILVKAVDLCTGQSFPMDTFNLIAQDIQAPIISTNFKTVVISNSPDACESSFGIDQPGLDRFFGIRVADNCTQTPIVAVKIFYFGPEYIQGVPIGPSEWRLANYPRVLVKGLDGKDYLTATKVRTGKHRLVIEAFDECLNKSTKEFEFTVADQFSPVMKCGEGLTVSLSAGREVPGGYAKVSTSEFDKGAYDNCGLRWVRVRRPYNPNSLHDFISSGYDSNGDRVIDPLDGVDWNKDGDIADFGERFVIDTKTGKLMTPLLDFVEFFCGDAGSAVPVEVWAEDISGNQGMCIVTTTIEDRLEPVWVLPEPVTVSCKVDSLMQVFGRSATLASSSTAYQRIVAALGKDIVIEGVDCGDYSLRLQVEENLVCGSGTVDLTWIITRTSAGRTLVRRTEPLRITVVGEIAFSLFFPPDTVASTCRTLPDSTLRTSVLGCDLLGVFVSDKRVRSDMSSTACYVVERTFTVVNWCNYSDSCNDPIQWAVVVPRDPGGDGYDGVTVLVRDIAPTDGTEEIYFDKNKNGLPEVEERVRTLTYNNSANTPCSAASKGEIAWMFTQHILVQDTIKPSLNVVQDLPDIPASGQCGSPVELRVFVQDDCAFLPDTGVVYGKPGTLTLEPIRILPDSLLYPGGVRLLEDFVPGVQVAYLGSNTWHIEGTFPEGTHTLQIQAVDPCGNRSDLRRFVVKVVDTSIPVPICKDLVTVELNSVDQNADGLPDAGSAFVLGSSFVKNSIYDCNGQGKADSSGLREILTYSVHRLGEAPNLSKDTLEFDCTDAWKYIPVDVYAWDQRGNKSSCYSYVLISDTAEACRNYVGSISGTVRTEDNKLIEAAEIHLTGGADKKLLTSKDGRYRFGEVDLRFDYQIAPYKNDDFSNGISTFDLVVMQQHILGVKPLTSPYKMIAADINNNRAITVLDVIQLRRLILNLETSFPSNRSWRFIPTSHTFTNPSNPWNTAFPEIMSFKNIKDSVARADFIGVKIGDVTGDVAANSTTTRSRFPAGQFDIKVKETSAKRGELIRVALNAADWKLISGCQFTFLFDRNALELLDIEEGLAKQGDWAVFEDDGAVGLSWARKISTFEGVDTPLLTLVFRATHDLLLSEHVQLSSRFVRAEAYQLDGTLLDLSLEFEGTTKKSNPELFPNYPNPFSDKTHIRFWLPVEQQAEIIVTDMKGSRIFQQSGIFHSGFHEITLYKSVLQASGVLFYSLKTEEGIVTKKMLLLD